MPAITVRHARESDTQTIADFNAAMALETEGKTLDSSTLQNGVARLFTKPQYGFYLIAETADEIAGCLMITYEWSDWRNGVFWWLQSVYVAPAFRCKGVFKSLYQKVESLAREDGDACGIRLYVEQDNQHAQHTYTTLGMQKTDYHLFESLL